MDVVFLDTSALIKLYVREKGSAWLRTFVSNKQIVIFELALMETATVIRKKYIQGSYSRLEAISLIARIRTDSVGFEIVPINGVAFRNLLTDIVFRITNSYGIRALDAIQLTSAFITMESIQNLTTVSAFTL